MGQNDVGQNDKKQGNQILHRSAPHHSAQSLGTHDVSRTGTIAVKIDVVSRDDRRIRG